MKNTTKQILAGLSAAAATLLFSSCDVDKKADGELPEVDVDVKTESGKLPEYEVNTPSVETGTKKVEVEVPTVDIKSAEDGDDK